MSIKNLSIYFKLLQANKLKFDGVFLVKLIDLIKQIYNKNVELNIVNLKKCTWIVIYIHKLYH